MGRTSRSRLATTTTTRFYALESGAQEMSSVASDQHVSPLGYTLDQVMDFLDACEKYLLSDAYVETMGKGIENFETEGERGSAKKSFSE